MNKVTLPLLAVLLLVISSCKKDKKETEPEISASLKKSVVENYAAIVYASYEDSYNKALEMKQKAQDFVASPSQAGLDALKTAWLNARIPYDQTEAYRFYGGPIDNDITGPEGFMNAWPMDESFVDYIATDANTGIINDPATYPTIDKILLESNNENGGETNISTGYHAIEFLLWGQDLSDSGPGARPYTDYITGGGGTASHQDRRGQYLIAACDLLADNLKTLVDAWKPGVSNNYRAAFVAAPDASLALIITGMGKLAKGELAGERMTVAYASSDQEDEHSCFSDNTHNDIILDQKGIYNVYIGKYVRTDGTTIDGAGIDDLVKVKHGDLNSQMIAKLDAATAAAAAIQPPFDQEISSSNTAGRERVLTAINAIKAEADKLIEVAAAIGVTIAL